MAYSTRDVLETMRKDSGLRIRELRVDGGASANDFLCRFQADVLGVAGRPAEDGRDDLARGRLPRGPRRGRLGVDGGDRAAGRRRAEVHAGHDPGPGRQALRRMAGRRPQSPRRLDPFKGEGSMKEYQGRQLVIAAATHLRRLGRGFAVPRTRGGRIGPSSRPTTATTSRRSRCPSAASAPARSRSAAAAISSTGRS